MEPERQGRLHSRQDYDYLRSVHLIEPDELEERIRRSDPEIRIVDMRGIVRTRMVSDGVQSAEYLGAREEYERGHIPGAIYLDWTSDIVDTDDPVPAQAAPPDKIKRVFESLGIGDKHLIVAYDAHPASQFATRLWWILRFYGHYNTRVLNGGWANWVRLEKPISHETPVYPRSSFTPSVGRDWRAAADDVAGLLGQTGTTLIDARDDGQYSGRIRRGLRGGRIPGARHVPREALFDTDGTFKPSAEIAELVGARGVPESGRVIAYCNGGVAATSVLFVLSMLGRQGLANYDGSWNEWTERTDLPIEADA